ncbi:hypothetical protein HDU98_009994 [Podochytrium sp. JEL0797]|nr:hypothetical protein HDU98_009994 [Podochytrium sp. JEL0797]
MSLQAALRALEDKDRELESLRRFPPNSSDEEDEDPDNDDAISVATSAEEDSDPEPYDPAYDPLKLFCCPCRAYLSIDSFSAKQKKEPDNEERYCLRHTSTSCFNTHYSKPERLANEKAPPDVYGVAIDDDDSSDDDDFIAKKRTTSRTASAKKESKSSSSSAQTPSRNSKPKHHHHNDTSIHGTAEQLFLDSFESDSDNDSVDSFAFPGPQTTTPPNRVIVLDDSDDSDDTPLTRPPPSSTTHRGHQNMRVDTNSRDVDDIDAAFERREEEDDLVHRPSPRRSVGTPLMRRKSVVEDDDDDSDEVPLTRPTPPSATRRGQRSVRMDTNPVDDIDAAFEKFEEDEEEFPRRSVGTPAGRRKSVVDDDDDDSDEIPLTRPTPTSTTRRGRNVHVDTNSRDVDGIDPAFERREEEEELVHRPSPRKSVGTPLMRKKSVVDDSDDDSDEVPLTRPTRTSTARRGQRNVLVDTKPVAPPVRRLSELEEEEIEDEWDFNDLARLKRMEDKEEEWRRDLTATTNTAIAKSSPVVISSDEEEDKIVRPSSASRRSVVAVGKSQPVVISSDDDEEDAVVCPPSEGRRNGVGKARGIQKRVVSDSEGQSDGCVQTPTRKRLTRGGGSDKKRRCIGADVEVEMGQEEGVGGRVTRGSLRASGVKKRARRDVESGDDGDSDGLEEYPKQTPRSIKKHRVVVSDEDD